MTTIRSNAWSRFKRLCEANITVIITIRLDIILWI